MVALGNIVLYCQTLMVLNLRTNGESNKQKGKSLIYTSHSYMLLCFGASNYLIFLAFFMDFYINIFLEKFGRDLHHIFPIAGILGIFLWQSSTLFTLEFTLALAWWFDRCCSMAINLIYCSVQCLLSIKFS